MEKQDIESLREAKRLLENPGLAAKLTNLIGSPIEAGLKRLPDRFNNQLGAVTRKSLLYAMKVTLFTMKDTPGKTKANRRHKLAAGTSGALGGAFGLAALTIELPISTTIMLRSIADIARSEGESLALNEAKLACIEVFALGSPSSDADDAVESGYFAVRAALAHSVSESAKYIATHGLKQEGAPVVAKLITKVANRFGVQIGEKAAAQAVPLIGAAGGALIN
ncbi:MAG: EcsC family protein, partial [Opitutales bacterium]